MINMAVKFGEVEGEPLFNSFLGLSQEAVNILIIFICLILIPLMLFVKPIYFYLKKSSTKGISFRNDIGLIENENKNDDILNINDDLKDNNIDNEENLNNSGEYSLSLSQESILKSNEHYSKLYSIQKRNIKQKQKKDLNLLKYLLVN